MPTFLSDPPQVVYLIIAAILIVAGLIWLNRRERRSAIVLCAALLFLAIFVLFDRLFESPREEVVRRVQAMSRAADAKDTEAFIGHVAEKIEYRGANGDLTISRDSLRHRSFWNILREQNVHVATWDFSRADVVEIDAKTIEIGFMAKGETPDGKLFPMYFRATFGQQPDGSMKMTAFASFDPVKRTNERTDLSGFLK